MLPGQKKKSQKQIKFEHRSKIVLNLIKTKPRITNEQLSIVIGIDSRFIKKLLKEMKELGMIETFTEFKRTKDKKHILEIRTIKEINNPGGPLNNTEINNPGGPLLTLKQQNPGGPLNNTESGPVSSKEEEKKANIKQKEMEKDYLKLLEDFQLDLFNWLNDKFLPTYLSQKEELELDNTSLEIYKQNSFKIVRNCKNKEFSKSIKIALLDFSKESLLAPTELLNSNEWKLGLDFSKNLTIKSIENSNEIVIIGKSFNKYSEDVYEV